MNPDIRIGQGFDVHAFAPGRALYIGGIEIPAARGLEGHSDADVLLHAIIDALLGATGRADIGTYFPDTDPQWRGVRSTKLLGSVMQELAHEGWRVVNCDCTVLAQEPKLAPFITVMRVTIAGLLRVTADRCTVKATTTERLGFVGRAEGIMASAAVLVSRES